MYGQTDGANTDGRSEYGRTDGANSRNVRSTGKPTGVGTAIKRKLFHGMYRIYSHGRAAILRPLRTHALRICAMVCSAGS